MISALAPAAAAQPLDLTAFFTGRTHGENDLRIVFRSTSKLVVDSVGRLDGKEFVLIDTVHEEGKPVRMRKWVMRAISPNHYTGTLTDAVGPVDILVLGRTATIRYVMRDGRLNVVEQMILQPDGRTLANHVVAKKVGITFAHVDGFIRKLD